MENIGVSLGLEIRRHREALGFSRETLSELSGIPARTIQDIETGKTKDPGVSTIMVLTKALGSPQKGGPLAGFGDTGSNQKTLILQHELIELILSISDLSDLEVAESALKALVSNQKKASKSRLG